MGREVSSPGGTDWGVAMNRERNARRRARWTVGLLLAGWLPLLLGCVSVAEFRKLDRRVRDHGSPQHLHHLIAG